MTDDLDTADAIGSRCERQRDRHTAKRLKVALVGRERTVIADVPYRRGRTTALRPRLPRSPDARQT